MSLKKLLAPKFLFAIFTLCIFVAGYWHWMAYQQFIDKPLSLPEQQQTWEINPGSGINRLAKNWQQQGIIENQFYLRFYCWLHPENQHIKAGEYLITKQDTPRSLLDKLSRGKVIQYSLTIVEGINSFQLLEQLATEKNLKQDFDQHPQSLIDSVGIASDHIEGWFYPDTYHFHKQSSGLDILKRSHQKMRQILQQEWELRAVGLPYNSAYEALIMASIIEKETSLPSERAKIAGVFVRRLEKKMRLGTDPTVIYGIGPTFNGDITFKNLRTLTPYNTYMIKGLPPTPIALPGKDAIHAALNPEEGDELYFVATGDGGHYFSATLAEHNAAVAKYQKRKK